WGVSLLFITHDRRFLDRLATRIVELDRGRLTSYPGSHAAYLARKEQELAAEAKAQARLDKLLKEEEAWIRQGVEARRTRAAFRVERLERLRSERAARRERLGQAKLRLDTGAMSGQLVAQLQQVSKSFGDKVVVRDFSTRILRGDRIGIIGPNGAGKSTLFRMIQGREQPDSGEIVIGPTAKIAAVDQSREGLENDKTVWEAVSGGQDILTVGKFEMPSRAYLGRFNFKGADQQKIVGNLSGGERGRLHLAKTLIQGGNVLLLDEPSNDLDVETLRALEDALLEFPGCVLVISHDRWFLDRIATHILACEGDSQWFFFEGNYREYEEDKKKRLGEEGARPHRLRYKPISRG
ncbi:MAG: ATP-binding cassette domain-containing protein, partial [Rhodocyclaceae bacterium]|nr:ATP-binding cassette domain-containing protein [Rhodocyclaceae bacterium]